MPPKKKNNAPRFDRYARLWSRFFEPLILLLSLGKTRGEHFSGPRASSPMQAVRRRVFDYIAYLCDYTKGGDSTSAIGLEDCEDCYIFWIASNQTSTKIVDFIEDILKDIKAFLILKSPRLEEAEKKFVHKCIRFASQRVNKEAKTLSNVFNRCIKHLEEQSRPEDAKLLQWLQAFDFDDYVALCERAYEQRKAPEMKDLVERSKTEHGESENSDRAGTFDCARHLLGRLAHHVRAPKQILEDAPNVPELSQRCFVRRIPLMKSVPAPEPDNLTKLESILKRMLPAKDPTLHRYQEALLNLDHRLGIQDRVIGQYKSPNFKPIVHAEIQVLEYFNQNNLRFVDDDRYISCSKPTCYCCHLYIRHHPLGIVEPASHQNIYPNWGLPLLSGIEDTKFPHQQNMLNKMLENIRREALTQISRQTTADDHKESEHSDSDKSGHGSSTSPDERSVENIAEREDDSDSDTINGDGDSERGGGAML
ncbi:hypothetical protein LQW54_012223 [Pestalotiopsis sp. IQ-011]